MLREGCRARVLDLDIKASPHLLGQARISRSCTVNGRRICQERLRRGRAPYRLGVQQQWWEGLELSAKGHAALIGGDSLHATA